MWSKTVTGIAAVGVLAAGPALADNGRGRKVGHVNHTDYVYARVVDVEPIVHYVTVERPREQCRDEVVRESTLPYGVAGPTIAGGVVGAAIGRQFGSGDERDALTLIGAIAGSAVAHRRARANQGYREVVVQRCETVSERFTEERIDGYHVTYEYDGRRYRMQTATPPGDRVRLAVDVRPVGYTLVRTRYDD